MARDIRYGVIGTGMMGIEHIENLNALEGAVVSAVSDPDPVSRGHGQRVAGVGDDAVFADHQSLLASGLVDAVVLASPNFTHAPILHDIIDAGLHVLAEKPLCTTVEDAVRVVDHADGYESVAWMGLEYRYKPPIAKLVADVGTGEVGDVKMVAIREHRFPFLPKVGDWNRFRRNTGGTLVEKCCHFFDLMHLVANADAVRVFASGGQDVNHLDERYGGETPDILDNAFVIVDYANGVRGMLDLCMFAEGSKNEQEISVVGDLGKIEAYVPENLVRTSYRGVRPMVDTIVADDTIAYMGLHEGASYLEHVDFLDAVRSGMPPKVTFKDGLRSVVVGIAAHRSIDEGRPVFIDEVI